MGLGRVRRPVRSGVWETGPRFYMRRRSVKMQRLMDERKADRSQFLEDCPTCAVCRMNAAEHVHEILAGSHRIVAYRYRSCWLGLCPECHRRIQSAVSVAKQLAWKLLSDPVFFDRSEVCRLWGRADTAVTSDEILQEVKSICQTNRYTPTT